MYWISCLRGSSPPLPHDSPDTGVAVTPDCLTPETMEPSDAGAAPTVWTRLADQKCPYSEKALLFTFSLYFYFSNFLPFLFNSTLQLPLKPPWRVTVSSILVSNIW